MGGEEAKVFVGLGDSRARTSVSPQIPQLLQSPRGEPNKQSKSPRCLRSRTGQTAPRGGRDFIRMVQGEGKVHALFARLIRHRSEARMRTLAVG